MLANNSTNESAMLAFLRQEIIRYNELLQIIHSSLNLLYSAVKGDSVMSKTMETTFNALLHKTVPLEWQVACIEILMQIYVLLAAIATLFDPVVVRSVRT